MRLTKNYWLLLGFCTVIGFSCKKWDDHIAGEQALDETLTEHIGKMPELSTFSSYLVKTGLDKVIGSSKNYTVWAPTNNALQSLPADVVNDTAKLKAYLMNHISGQLFFTRNAADSVRVPLLNGKRNFFYRKTFDDAAISQPDIYVRNGALHVIDKVIAPLPSVWEFIQGNQTDYAQNAYIGSLQYKAQDPAKAELDSINPATGQPVYKANTGIVEVNTFRTKVYDVANEDSLYTYILLTNSGYTTETDKQKPFFKSSIAAITNSNAQWNVVKDLAIKGLYKPGQIPATLLSKFNVNVPVNAGTIVDTRKLSNGIAYIVSEAPVNQKEKIPTVKIEGENPFAFSTNIVDRHLPKVFYRNRFDSVNKQPFKDIYLNLGTSGANQFVDYITNNIYTAKYKVYWVAFNDKTVSSSGRDADYGTDSVLQQILKIGPHTDPYTAPFSVQKPVKQRDYSLVYIGDYTNPGYDWWLSYPDRTADGKDYTQNPATRRIRLQAPATLTSGIPFNLTLDQVVLVPDIP